MDLLRRLYYLAFGIVLVGSMMLTVCGSGTKTGRSFDEGG
jgi:hypothetical protein